MSLYSYSTTSSRTSSSSLTSITTISNNQTTLSTEECRFEKNVNKTRRILWFEFVFFFKDFVEWSSTNDK